MDFIIGWRKYDTIFHGEAVTMELHPMSNRDAAIVLPFVGQFKTSDVLAAMNEQEQADYNALIMGEIDTVKQVLTERCRDIAGFTVNGAAPTIDLIFSAPVFFPLIANVAMELVNISYATGKDEKNLERQSGDETGVEAPIS